MKLKNLCFELCRIDKIRFVLITILFCISVNQIQAQIPDLTLLISDSSQSVGVAQCIATGNTMGMAFSLEENINENIENIPIFKGTSKICYI